MKQWNWLQNSGLNKKDNMFTISNFFWVIFRKT